MIENRPDTDAASEAARAVRLKTFIEEIGDKRKRPDTDAASEAARDSAFQLKSFSDELAARVKTNVLKRQRPNTEVIRQEIHDDAFRLMSFEQKLAYPHGSCLKPANGNKNYCKYNAILSSTLDILADLGITIGNSDFAGKTINVLELCGGSKCAEQALQIAFPKAEISHIRVDRDPKSGAGIIADICNWKGYADYPEGHFDIILAWPDCSQLSNMHSNAKKARDIEGTLNLISAIKNIIKQLAPKFFLIENPCNNKFGLRVQPVMQDMARYLQTHHYCKWGFPYPKLTDIWCSHTIPHPGLCHKGSYCCNKDKHGIHAMTPQYIQDLWMRHQVPYPLLVAAFRQAFRPL